MSDGGGALTELKLGDLQGTIRGIVHSSGLDVYRRDGSFWMRRIYFHIHVWRLGEQPVQTRRLLVTLVVPRVMMPLWRRRLAPGATISFVSGGIERFGSRTPQVPLTTFLGTVDDPELLEVEASSRNPDILETPEFGRLPLDRYGMDYVGQCTWYGLPVELELAGDDEGSVEGTLQHARTLLATWPEWPPRLRKLVARQLIPVWHELHEGEPPIDPDILYARLRLQRLMVMADGAVQLVMEAGEEFDGDDLSVEGTVAAGPTEIYPEG
jgi:hypothetical protein